MSKKPSAPKVAGGFTPAEAAALQAASRNTDATPTAVLAAFCPPVTEAGGLRLVPYSAQHRLVLEAAKSPFVQPGAQDNGAIAIGDYCFAILVLSMTGPQLRAAQQTPDEVAMAAAMQAIAGRLPGSDTGLAEVRRQVCGHLAAAAVTIIAPGLGGPAEDDDPLAASRSQAPAAAGS